MFQQNFSSFINSCLSWKPWETFSKRLEIEFKQSNTNYFNRSDWHPQPNQETDPFYTAIGNEGVQSKRPFTSQTNWVILWTSVTQFKIEDAAACCLLITQEAEHSHSLLLRLGIPNCRLIWQTFLESCPLSLHPQLKAKPEGDAFFLPSVSPLPFPARDLLYWGIELIVIAPPNSSSPSIPLASSGHSPMLLVSVLLWCTDLCLAESFLQTQLLHLPVLLNVMSNSCVLGPTNICQH